MIFKGCNGMLVVGSHKDDRWNRLIAFVQAISEIDPRKFRHPDIEKEHIVFTFLHHFESLDGVFRRIQRFDIVPAAQRLLQCASREWFVVHNQDTHGWSPLRRTNCDSGDCLGCNRNPGKLRVATATSSGPILNTKVPSFAYKCLILAAVFRWPSPSPCRLFPPTLFLTSSSTLSPNFLDTI